MEESHEKADGPIAILWDMENCKIPIDVHPGNVAGSIRSALHAHSLINGPIKMFSAYGDCNGFSKLVREGCQRTGVKLIDVPNGSKDAADKAILVDMFLFALDNPPPCSIMLISSDVDFSSALHVLGQRGYTVILVVPSGQFISSALTNAGSHVWDWFSLIRGKGLVPPLKNHQIIYSKNEEEKEPVVCKEMSVATQSSTEKNSDDLICAQPGDLTNLKGQLVKLLKTSGGCLSCDVLQSEYEKMFGRPLCVSDYGTSELVDLLKKMRDAISFEGEGSEKIVLLEERLTKAIIEPKTEVSQERKRRKRSRRKTQSISVSSPSNDQDHNVLQTGTELHRA